MKSEKGFSFVELIIVIAIISILIAVVVPVTIMYLNKSKVSSDYLLCDTLQTAITVAMNDPDVLNSSDNSHSQINDIKSGSVIEMNGLSDSLFVETVNEIMGYDVSSDDNNREHFRTKTAKNEGVLKVQFYNSSFYVWIDGSDATGKDAVAYSVADASAIGDNVIYVK